MLNTELEVRQKVIGVALFALTKAIKPRLFLLITYVQSFTWRIGLLDTIVISSSRSVPNKNGF